MSEVILSIQNITKTYPHGVKALKGISFDVKKGEFVVIIGASGSGKSTLLKCLNRLQDLTSGEVFLFDHHKKVHISEIKNKTEIQNLRKKMGMIFQQFNLIPRHSVLSNVLMGKLAYISTWRSIFGLFTEAQRKEGLQYLRLVGIAEKAYTRVDQLSGGQQQRVAIARTLMQNPQVLLSDEPVSSLDPSASTVVMDYLKKVNRELGITIICNLHSLSLMRQYAQRVIALKDGELIYDGDVEKIDSEWFARIYGN